MDREALIKHDWLFSGHGVANSDWRLVPHLRKIKATVKLKNLKTGTGSHLHINKTKTIYHFVLRK